MKNFFLQIFDYIKFFFHGAKEMDWRAMPKNLTLEARDQWQRASKNIKKEYGAHLKTSSHLPPNFYVMWEAWVMFWRNKGFLFGIIFFPWLLSTISSSVFLILLPKSLLFNYGASSLINFMLIALCIYPVSFWAIGEGTKNKTLSLRFSSWNAQKKDFIIKIFLWVLVSALVFVGSFLIINQLFDFIGGLLRGQLLHSILTALILLCYLTLTIILLYAFASWLMFIPYAIFQSRFHLLSVKQLYDLENFEDELKIFFGIIRQYHIWIFTLFLAMLIIPLWVSMNGLVLATIVYYAGTYATFWLPITIRSNIVQVILMDSVISLVSFVGVTIITIALSRAFWLLRYQKPANFPKTNKK
ncbi:MAG: hypothetical protein QM529_06680 [Hydrotalea sp.]|nr:hypothetical protein [Hydrotalea sp.]